MQYANATRAAAQVALASVLAQYPEIQGLSAEQLPIALQTMQAVDPNAPPKSPRTFNEQSKSIGCTSRPRAKTLQSCRRSFSTGRNSKTARLTRTLRVNCPRLCSQ